MLTDKAGSLEKKRRGLAFSFINEKKMSGVLGVKWICRLGALGRSGWTHSISKDPSLVWRREVVDIT